MLIVLYTFHSFAQILSFIPAMVYAHLLEPHGPEARLHSTNRRWELSWAEDRDELISSESVVELRHGFR